MALDIPGRHIVHTNEAQFQPFDLDGYQRAGITYLPLNFNRKTGVGSYLSRMEPGAETGKHTHSTRVEFMVLEGRLTDNDGTTFEPGDHVYFEPGSGHNTRAEEACLLIGIEWPD